MTAKFEKIDSGIPGVEAFKPNQEMQIETARELKEKQPALYNSPMMAGWRKLLGDD